VHLLSAPTNINQHHLSNWRRTENVTLHLLMWTEQVLEGMKKYRLFTHSAQTPRS